MDPINPFELTEKPRNRTPLEIRRDAAQATLDRYRGVPFEMGKVDCYQMVKSHCRQLGRPLKIGQPVAYSSPITARAMLRKVGFKSLSGLMSAKFAEIAPAEALVGDAIELAAAEDDHALGGLVIYMGNNAVFGFHEAIEGATVMRIGEDGFLPPIRAWRLLA